MTTIVGKDASLEDTLAHFKDIEKKLGLEFVEDMWLNPLPDLWSVHLYVASCPAIYSNGKGSTHDAALASAYGEIFERLATHMSFSDYFLGKDNNEESFVHFRDERWSEIEYSDEDENNDSSEQEYDEEDLPSDILTPKLRQFYGQDSGLKAENLLCIQSCNFARGICSIPFTNARNGEIVYFPINLLDNLYASNGMSAGNTEYEALVQGLSEIIERYIKAKIIREGLALPKVPERILEKYPKSYATLQGLQSEDLKAICYDASLGGNFPVVCVVLFNASNGTCVASFGSHPIFEVALDRTLTELMQGRTFSDLDNFEKPTFNLEQTSDDINIESHFVDSTGLLPMQMFHNQPKFKFVHWDFQGSTHAQYKALRHIINKLGFEIYVRTYQNLGVPVYRIIVPGMSEIYPIDDLVFNNNNRFVAYQEALLKLPSSQEDSNAFKIYLDELENEDVEDEALVCKLLGVLPDKGTAWETLRLGELKCLIALEAEEYEKALEYARFTVQYNASTFSIERLKFYECLIQILECNLIYEIDDANYQDALALLYGKKTVINVNKHINHSSKFFDLVESDLNLTNFKQHQALIDVYKKIKHASLQS